MWIEETKNGKYKFIERYTDHLTGKTKRVSVALEKNTAQSRKLAQKILDDKISSTYSMASEKELTLSNLVEEYLMDQKDVIKASTWSRNKYVCKTLVKILGEDLLVNNLNARYVRTKLLETKDKPVTLNGRLERFKAMIRWGYKNDLVDDIRFLDKIEPFKDISHRQKVQDKYLESDELKKLVEGMNIEIWALITQFLALSGLRIGEMMALENKDIDDENLMIHVTKTYDTNNALVTSTKTQCSIREVYMHKELFAVCKRIRILMLKQRLQYRYRKSNLFLHNKRGGIISYDAYRKYLKEHSECLLGRKITPHALRHTHASLLLENEVQIDTISRRLGHENSKVTKEIYLHITEKIKQRDNEQLKDIKIM